MRGYLPAPMHCVGSGVMWWLRYDSRAYDGSECVFRTAPGADRELSDRV